MKQRASRLTPVARAVRGSRLVDFATEWPFAEYAQSGGRMRGTWNTRPLAAAQTRLLPYAPHNLLRHSNDPNNVVWNKSNVSVTAAGSEWLLTTTSTVDPYLMQEITPVTSRWTQSVTVRQGTAAKVQLRPITFYGSGQVRDYSVFFDFATETFAGSNAGSDLSCSFDRLSGGRYRLHVTTAAQVSQTFAQIRVAGANASFNIGQVGLTVYVSDMQMCHGSNTEYVATTTVAQTRIAPYLPHNLLLQSGDLAAAPWASSGNGTTASTTAGVTTVIASGGPTARREQIRTFGSGRVTLSVDIQAGTATSIVVGMSDLATGDASVTVNPTTGATSSLTNVASWSASAVTVVSLGAGWFRVNLSSTKGAGATVAAYVDVMSGTGTTVLVKRAQVNQGGPLDYVPTTTAAVPAVLDSVVQYSPHNLILWSQEIDNAAWLKSASGTGTSPTVTGAGNTVVAPDGTLTADAVVFNAGANGASDTSQLQSSAFTAAAASYTFSVWLCTTDGSTKTIQISIAGAAASNLTIGPTWARYDTTWAASAGSWNARVTAGAGITSATASVAVWGAQVRLASSLSDYVPTTTAARYLPFPGTLAPAAAMPGPWGNLTRTGLATVTLPNGLVGYGPHNLLWPSANFTSAQWIANAAATDVGAGLDVDGTPTRRFTSSSFGGGWYNNFRTVVAGDVVTLNYYVSRVSGTRYFLCGCDSLSQTLASFNPADGTFASGPATKGAVAVPGGWRVWVTYTFASGGNISSTVYAGGVGSGSATFDVAAWSHVGAALLAYVPTTTAARYLPRQDYDPALSYDGSAYSVAESYGAERVTNGDFASAAGWTADANWSISGGVATASAANGTSIYQAGVFELGKTYRVTGTASISSGELRIWDNTTQPTVTAASGAFSIFYTPRVNTTLYLLAVGPMTGTVDNISVQEYLGTTTTGTPRALGLRVEGAAMNLHPQSNTAAGYYIVVGSGLTSAPTQPDPSGSIGGFVLNYVDGGRIQRNVTADLNVSLVWSFYVRKGTGPLVLDFGYTSTFTGGGSSTIDLASGSVTVGSAQVINSGEFWRVWMALTPTAGTGADVVFYSIAKGTSGVAHISYSSFGPGSVATSYIPNDDTGTAARAADFAGPGLALTGDALTSAFPAGFGQNTIVLRFRKRYPSPALETLLALSAGSSYNAGNGLLIRVSGVGQLEAGGNNSDAKTPAFSVVNDGVTVNCVAVSWSGVNLSLSLNGGTPVTLSNLDFTGVGTTHLLFGSLNLSGLQTMGSVAIDYCKVYPGQYITGSALQALSA